MAVEDGVLWYLCLVTERDEVILELRRRFRGAGESIGEAVIVNVDDVVTWGLPQTARLIIPIEHVPATPAEGPDTAHGIVTWLLRDLAEEIELKPTASYFVLQPDGHFVGLAAAARREV